MAVFACYDNRGQQLLEACRRVGLSVPEEVAVLGVDNDEVLCMLSPPPLSSIILNPERTGWEAASLLATLMEGRNPPSQPLLIPPVGIRIRQSTDILAVADAKIAAALKYIREHACESIGVTDVLRQTPMARRSLEMRFERLLHRSPRAEILRVRLNRVRELLVGTELPIWEIAGRAGFDPEYMSVVFKREAGMSPREYRRAYGLNPPAQG
jgi:LacI family transcriptional regulator